MENYILSFKAPLKALLARNMIFDKLHESFPQVQLKSIEMDDKHFIMQVYSKQRIEEELQQAILEAGHRVIFMSAIQLESDQNSALIA